MEDLGCYFILGTTESTEYTEGLGLLPRFLTAKKDEMRERKTWVVGLGFEFSASRRDAEAQRFFNESMDWGP